MDSLKIFTQKCSNDDFRLAVSFLWQGQNCFQCFYMEKVHGFLRRFGAKVKKYS